MAVRIRDLVRRRQVPASSESAEGELAERVCSELSVDLPDEGLGEYLYDCIELYEMGSKPRCEEVEYLDLMQEAIERIERG